MSKSQNWISNSARSVYSGTLRLTSKKTEEKWWKRICCFIERIRSNCVAYSRIVSRRNQSRFDGRAQNSWDESAARVRQKVHLTTQKFGKERFHRKELCRSVNFTGLAIRTMRPQRSMGFGDQWQGQNHVHLTFRSLVFSFTIFEETWGKIICGGLRSIDAHAEQEWNFSGIQKHHHGYTANGEVRTHEEATVHVHDLELFVTVQILVETPAGLSLGKLCEERGYSYEWAGGQKPNLTKNDKNKCGTKKSQDCRQILPARAQVRLSRRYRRTRLLSLVESSNSTRWRHKHSGIGKPVARFTRVVRGVQRKSQRQWSGIKGHTRTHFSWLRFGTAHKSGIQDAQCLYSLPKRTKLRSTQENQDYKRFQKLSKWLQRQELKLTTRSTERNPTMCEVTWNTWGTCERSWCQCICLHALRILRLRSLSSLLSVSVVVLWLSSLLDARTLWLKFESPFIPQSSSYFMCAVSVASDLFDFSIHFISFLIISIITLLFLLPLP